MAQDSIKGYRVTTPEDKPSFTYVDLVEFPADGVPEGAVRINDLMADLVRDGFAGRWPYRQKVGPGTNFRDVIHTVAPGLYIET